MPKEEGIGERERRLRFFDRADGGFSDGSGFFEDDFEFVFDGIDLVFLQIQNIPECLADVRQVDFDVSPLDHFGANAFLSAHVRAEFSSAFLDGQLDFFNDFRIVGNGFFAF